MAMRAMDQKLLLNKDMRNHIVDGVISAVNPRTKASVTFSFSPTLFEGARIEKPAPVSQRTRVGKTSFSALVQSSKTTSKPTQPIRRSARIAEKERRLKDTGLRSESAKE